MAFSEGIFKSSILKVFIITLSIILYTVYNKKAWNLMPALVEFMKLMSFRRSLLATEKSLLPASTL